MRKLASKLRAAAPALCPLALAPLLSLLLLFLAGCAASLPIPLTVRQIQIERVTPPALLLNPACPAEPVAPDLSAATWESDLVDWISQLIERGNCLDAALGTIREWSTAVP